MASDKWKVEPFNGHGAWSNAGWQMVWGLVGAALKIINQLRFGMLSRSQPAQLWELVWLTSRGPLLDLKSMCGTSLGESRKEPKRDPQGAATTGLGLP